MALKVCVNKSKRCFFRPQHTRSWKGIPGIVLECPSVKPRDPNDYDDSFKKMDIAVLNISSPTTLEVGECYT